MELPIYYILFASYLWSPLTWKLAQMMGMDFGFLSPTFMFAIGCPLHKSMRISAIPSVVFGSSRQNGMVDLQHLPIMRASVVLFVFITKPFVSCPQRDKAVFAAVDFPEF